MWHKVLLIGLLLAVMVMPALAQENIVRLNGFGFDLTLAPNVNITRSAGDAPETAGPGFSDAAHTLFNMYNLPPAPESPFESVAGVRLYRMDDLAQYDFLMEQVEQLQNLLAERPDLTAFETVSENAMWNTLPYVPVLTHGQVLRAQATYIDTEAVRGIGYITATMAAAEPFMNNSFSYVFQGISADGQFYISANFMLNTDLFPAEIGPDYNIETFDWLQATKEAVATLNAAAPGDFTPSLDAIGSLINSMAFER
jgi:hypothetical protein